MTDEELAVGCLYPALQKVPEISIKIAVAVAEECYKVGWNNEMRKIKKLKDGTAKLYPEPVDKELFVRSQAYQTEYEEMMPKMMVNWGIK